MPTCVKLALLGAAVAAVAGCSGSAGGSPAVATATPAPTVAASATADTMPSGAPPTLPNGTLAAGSYAAHPLPGMTWTITVPAGWTGADDWFLSYDQAPDVHSVSVGGPNEGWSVPKDSCASAGTKAAATVDEFVAAAQARKDWTVSAPADVTVGGYSGKRIDLEVPTDAACADGSHYAVLANPDGLGYRAHGSDRRFRLWILDVDGKPIVIFRLNGAESPADRVSEGDAIVETSVIKP